MATQIDRDPLLDQLLDRLGQQPPAQPIAAPVESTPDRPAPRSARSTSKESPFFWLAALAFALALWLAGGYFTLEALHALYPPIVARLDWPWQLPIDALLCWLIPIAVSALEFGSAKRRGAALLVFVLVATFDLGSTLFGMLAWADQRVVFGITLSGAFTRSNAGLLFSLLALSIVLTFAPEWIGKRAVAVLWALVR